MRPMRWHRMHRTLSEEVRFFPNNILFLLCNFVSVIEKYTQNVRFCFICNYLNKIIPAIQSRCTKFRFAPLVSSQISSRLDYIIKEENVNATEDGKQSLIDLAQGDMRKVLNILQSVASAFDVVNEANVYKCCGIPSKSDIRSILEWLLTGTFTQSYKSRPFTLDQHWQHFFPDILQLQHENGYALQDILQAIHTQLFNGKLRENNSLSLFDFGFHFVAKLETKVKIEIFEKLANIEYNLSAGGLEKVQLPSLVAAFQCARDCKWGKLNCHPLE